MRKIGNDCEPSNRVVREHLVSAREEWELLAEPIPLNSEEKDWEGEDDDARSVHAVAPHEVESVEEEVEQHSRW